MPTSVKSKMCLFADDAKQYRERNKIEMQNKNLEEWSNNSLPKFNDEMTVSMRKLIVLQEVLAMWDPIGEGEEEKDLGVTIDSKLSFELHIFAKVKQTSSEIALFKKFLN